MARYKNRALQLAYEKSIAHANERGADFFNVDGTPRTSHSNTRIYFWAGVGVRRCPQLMSGSVGAAIYQAGKQWARENKELVATYGYIGEPNI